MPTKAERKERQRLKLLKAEERRRENGGKMRKPGAAPSDEDVRANVREMEAVIASLRKKTEELISRESAMGHAFITHLRSRSEHHFIGNPEATAALQALYRKISKMSGRKKTYQAKFDEAYKADMARIKAGKLFWGALDPNEADRMAAEDDKKKATSAEIVTYGPRSPFGKEEDYRCFHVREFDGAVIPCDCTQVLSCGTKLVSECTICEDACQCVSWQSHQMQPKECDHQVVQFMPSKRLGALMAKGKAHRVRARVKVVRSPAGFLAKRMEVSPGGPLDMSMNGIRCRHEYLDGYLPCTCTRELGRYHLSPEYLQLEGLSVDNSRVEELEQDLRGAAGPKIFHQRGFADPRPRNETPQEKMRREESEEIMKFMRGLSR